MYLSRCKHLTIQVVDDFAVRVSFDTLLVYFWNHNLRDIIYFRIRFNRGILSLNTAAI